MAFVTLALIFAGTNKGFGQAVHYSEPRPITCVNDALHPRAGISYTYEATGVDAGGKWHFYATKDPDFIETTGGTITTGGTTVMNTSTAIVVDLAGTNKLVAASGDYNIAISATTGNTDGNVDITWSYDILTKTEYQGTPDPTFAAAGPTFVVAYYVDAAGCTDNIKVWEIDPIYNFTVDVLSIEADAPATAPDYAVVAEDCFSPVESAIYNGGNDMLYNYGENYLYWEIVAANFVDNWSPTFSVTGVNAPQTLGTVEFTYALPATWGAATTWNTLAADGTTDITIHPDALAADPDMSEGVSIFVRVLVDHATFEGLENQDITLIVDGQDAGDIWDINNNVATPVCENVGASDQADTSVNRLTKRPTVTDAAMPVPNFVEGNEE